ncbi:unnamed protein product [Calicophoron daubneyi]|uniref:Uncharacterized protein n=1 Tax=Calicophoron daubneyi TaxID=300641 RepID=A0AAV2TDK7_CALDB
MLNPGNSADIFGLVLVGRVYKALYFTSFSRLTVVGILKRLSSLRVAAVRFRFPPSKLLVFGKLQIRLPLFIRGLSGLAGGVDIYRAPNRLRLYRGFGLFCLGHTFFWAGITYYQGWYTAFYVDALKQQGKKLGGNFTWLFSRSKSSDHKTSPDNRMVQSSDAKDNQEAKPDVNIKSPLKNFETIASLGEKLKEFSQKTRKYDRYIMPILTASLAVFTLACGYIIPRRIVRRITLLPIRLTSPKTTSHAPLGAENRRLIEIETYDSFGFRPKGVVFQIPMGKLSPMHTPNVSTDFLNFGVKGKFFRFFVEKRGAEFPFPEEFDFTFSQHD